MSDSSSQSCSVCPPGLGGPSGKTILKDGLWTSNPIAIQILGICSALAVTSRLENSLVMGGRWFSCAR